MNERKKGEKDFWETRFSSLFYVWAEGGEGGGFRTAPQTPPSQDSFFCVGFVFPIPSLLLSSPLFSRLRVDVCCSGGQPTSSKRHWFWQGNQVVSLFGGRDGCKPTNQNPKVLHKGES